ncbi:hypothetical protein [Actinokineospora globicatena]|nr:hypothetical protein [Actinokineospora globicatena]
MSVSVEPAALSVSMARGRLGGLGASLRGGRVFGAAKAARLDGVVGVVMAARQGVGVDQNATVRITGSGGW